MLYACYMHTSACIRLCTCTCMHKIMYMEACLHVYTYMHAHRHIYSVYRCVYVCKHTHTCMLHAFYTHCTHMCIYLQAPYAHTVTRAPQGPCPRYIRVSTGTYVTERMLQTHVGSGGGVYRSGRRRGSGGLPPDVLLGAAWRCKTHQAN